MPLQCLAPTFRGLGADRGHLAQASSNISKGGGGNALTLLTTIKSFPAACPFVDSTSMVLRVDLQRLLAKQNGQEPLTYRPGCSGAFPFILFPALFLEAVHESLRWKYFQINAHTQDLHRISQKALLPASSA